MKFGLICEGVTDFHVLKHVIQAYFEEGQFRPIQPNLDETHKKTAEDSFGGWGLVSAYLKSDHLEQTLADMDYVVVQIDTDVCEQKHFDVSPIGLADTDHQAFYEQIKLKLIEWMDSYEDDTYDYYKDKIIFAISIHSLECWLLAYHDSSNKKCKIKGCESALNIFLGKKGKSISKNAQDYIEHSKDFKKSKNHKGVIAKSDSFRMFIEQLASI
jgi:hypothetical protein